MNFITQRECEKCGARIIVSPAYDTVAKTNQRSLPAWKRCFCGWQEITTSELNALVPGWNEKMDPGDPNEKLED